MFVDVSSAGPVQEPGHRPAVHRDRGQDAELKENSQVGQNKKIFLVFYSTILGSIIKSLFLAGHSVPDTLGILADISAKNVRLLWLDMHCILRRENRRENTRIEKS